MVLNHKVTGTYINRVNNGLSLKLTLVSVFSMWIMISFTTFVVFKGNFRMQMIMIALGAIGTVVQFIVLRRKKKKITAKVPSNDKNNKSDL